MAQTRIPKPQCCFWRKGRIKQSCLSILCPKPSLQPTQAPKVLAKLLRAAVSAQQKGEWGSSEDTASCLGPLMVVEKEDLGSGHRMSTGSSLVMRCSTTKSIFASSRGISTLRQILKRQTLNPIPPNATPAILNRDTLDYLFPLKLTEYGVYWDLIIYLRGTITITTKPLKPPKPQDSASSLNPSSAPLQFQFIYGILHILCKP